MKGDWTETVKDDLKELEINKNFMEITNMSKEKFKQIVKEQTEKYAFKFLIQIHDKNKKTKGCQYVKL